MARAGAPLDFDTSTPAVVLKFDPNVLHHGGLGVVRSLGGLGVPVYAVHEKRLAPAAHSRYVAGRWLWRPDPAEAEKVLVDLRKLARRIGRAAVLFPTDDVGAIFLAEHGAALHEWFRFASPPPDLPRQVAGKYALYQLCRRIGVPCPESVRIQRWSQATEFVERVGFPVIGKRADPGTPAGTRSTEVLRTTGDLRRFHLAGDGLMLQEFVPGGFGHDWFFHGYRDTKARCVPAFTGVKERSYPAHAGLTSLGRSVDNPGLRRQAIRLLDQLGFAGLVDLDFRWDVRDGRYKLLDFNPRLGAQFRLFRDSAGIDVALAAYLDLTGQTLRGCAAQSGRRFLVENYDPIAALGYWRRGELGLRDWAGSLRRVDETAWLAGDDPVPFALMCLWMGWRGVTRRWTSPRSVGEGATRGTKGVDT